MKMKRRLLHIYMFNTSFHGLRYFAEKNLHWTERLFWTICCSICWLASFILIHSAWNDFQNNAVSFVVETNYLNWNTNFPSIYICETENFDKVAKFADKLYGDPHEYALDEILNEIIYFHGQSFYTLNMCGPDVDKPNENCFKREFMDYIKEIRSTCNEIFHSCQWNQQPIDCCQYFHKIPTELGDCFAINSNQHKWETKRFPMVSNRSTGPGQLNLKLYGVLHIYVLDSLEVPSFFASSSDFIKVVPHVYYKRFFHIKEIENQQEVRDVNEIQRKCKFMDEANFDVYPNYSYTSCCVQCRKDAQIHTCNCSHHLMPNTNYQIQCNYNGLDCLNKHYTELFVSKTKWRDSIGLVCNCLPSCTEAELTIIRDEKFVIEENYSIVELVLNDLPTTRFQRKVVRGKLDLVVSMGGSLALFIGASLLSFVEIIYYFIIMPVDIKKRNKSLNN